MSDLEFTELDSLKQIADNKGISYHPNIGLDKLKEKIAEFDAGLEEKKVAMTPAQAKRAALMKRRKEVYKDSMKLVRVRITCMNPAKREWQGEYLSVGNAVLGFHTKFVHFDHEYHLTQFMVDNLKQRTFRISKEVPDGKGGKYRKNIFPKEYNIEILPPLTKEELEDLARDQAARNAIGD